MLKVIIKFIFKKLINWCAKLLYFFFKLINYKLMCKVIIKYIFYKTYKLIYNECDWCHFNKIIIETSSTLTVVARDFRGNIIKVWSKIHTKCSLISAEASAILWAVQLMHQEFWNHIIVESDSKNLFWSSFFKRSYPLLVRS